MSRRKNKKKLTSQPLDTQDSQYTLEELEQRMLFSADVADVFLYDPSQANQPANEVLVDENLEVINAASADSRLLELIFIDANTPDAELLINDLLAGEDSNRHFEVVTLDADRDGIEQISEALGERQGIDAIHIISHGSDGQVVLGNTTLSQDSIATYNEQLQSWGLALDPDADILIYGCNLAATADGQTLIDNIAALTGADIAASDDLTGHASLGGDWELEYVAGSVSTEIVVTELAQASWQGTLEQTLWLSTDSNVAGPGANGLPGGWTEGQVLDFGGGSLAHGDATSGDFSQVLDFDTFTVDATDPGALHFVSRDMTVGGVNGTFDLKAGDVLVSFLQDETILAAYSDTATDTLYGDQDLLVFRPTSYGNYSSGTFYLLLDEVVADDLKGATLIEQDTTIGGTDVAAGSFLIIAEVSGTTSVDLFVPTGVGAGTTTGSTTPFIDLTDLGLDANSLRGIEVIEAATTVGGQALAKGDILVTLNVDDNVSGVAGNNLLVDKNDVFVLTLTSTGAASTAGTAAMFLDGSDVGLDNNPSSENPYALALHNYGQLTVDTTSDVSDGDTSSIEALILSKGADGKISLREAIEAANATPNGDVADVITFNITDPLIDGAHTIMVGNIADGDNGELPGITDAVVIDGTTDSDFAGTPIIELDGRDAGPAEVAAGRRVVLPWAHTSFLIDDLNANGETIMLRSLEWASGNLAPASANVLFVVQESGSLLAEDTAKKVLMESWGYTVTVIDVNDSQVDFDAAVELNDVVFITKDITSSDMGTKLRNAPIGVVTEELSITDVEFGLNASHSWDTSVLNLNIVDNTNYITSVFGTGNLQVFDVAQELRYMTGAEAADLQTLGTTGGGDSFVIMEAGGQLYDGTSIDGLHITAGDTTVRGLVINRFSDSAIELGTGSGNVIQGNYIGTDVTGTLNPGNGPIGGGIVLWGGTADNLIGGTGVGDGNIIANQVYDAIYLNDDAGTGTTILGNSIFNNGGIGIELVESGPTWGVSANDAGDGDGGANNLQNYPLISAAELSGTDLWLSGLLDTDGATTQYRLEFYGNVAGTQDATNGEGRYYLGETTVTTDGSGDAAFNSVRLFGVTLVAGDFVTATATEITTPAQVGIDDQLAYGDTSEFAVNFAITDSAKRLNFTVSSTPGISEELVETATFTVTLSGDALAGGETAGVDINATGSAVSGTDYDNFIAAITTAAGLTTGVTFDGTDTLTFDSAFNSGTGLGAFAFTVDAIDDAATEGTETIVATLSNPSATNGTASFGTFSDSFTEAGNTNITVHTPDSGLPWELYDNNSTYNEAFIDATTDAIQGGFRASSENDTGQAYNAGTGPTSADQTISFTLSAIETDDGTKPVGLFGRSTDINNFYYLRILPNDHPTQDSISLWKMAGGTPLMLASVDTTIAAGDTFTLELTDGAKKAYHNDVEVLSSANNDLTAAGEWGFFLGNFNGVGGHYRDTWNIDNFIADDGSSTVSATTNITETDVNDAPTVNATASDTGTEDTDQVYTHAQMLTLIGAADVDDADANLSIAITSVVNGSIALSGGTGGAGTTFTFTPTTNFVGNITFDYQVSDDESPTPASSAVGTATVALSAVNDVPTDLQVVATTEGGTNVNNDSGNDIYFVADDGGTLLGGLTTLTIEASFSSTTPDPGDDLTPLLSYAQGTNDEELALLLKSDGRIWFAASTNGAQLQSTAGNYMQLFDGEKHHVGVSWDASTGAVDFYVDGALVESFTGYQTGQSVTGGGELVFGQDQDSVLGGFRDFDVFKGTLYDIRVFDDIRTAGEIAAGYEQTLPPAEPNMIANWTFGDLSTGGVITEAVSGNNLTLQHVVPGVGTWVASTPDLTLSIAEDAPDLTVVGSVAAIDPDAGDTFLYSLQDNAGGRFDIDSTTGEIFVLDTSLLDFETDTSHNITVRVTDSGLETYDEVFTIEVTDANDAPVAANDAYSVDEDTTLAVNWWNTSWTTRQTLTFNNLAQTENLADFPVLVKLNSGNIDYTKTQDNGEDLRFFDDDGTALAHEIEVWNESGDSFVWVKVPQVDGLSNADFITMYYGNAGAADGQAAESVWSNGYAGVWHLDDDPSLGVNAIDDSSANPIDGTASNMDGTNLVTGKIGGALDFDGANEYIRVNSGASDKLAITGTEITIEAWVKRDGTTGSWMVMVNRQLGTTNADAYVTATKFGANPDVYILNTDGGYVESSAGAVPDATWQYLTAVQDGTDMRLYSNGVEVGSATGVGPIITDDNDVIFGGAENDGTSTITEFFQGVMDEIRISNVARSADWVAAQYASMDDTFVSFGGEEPVPATGGVLNNDSDADGDVLTAILVSGPSNADSFTFNADGTFIYTPTADFHGTDTFTYKVNDGAVDSGVATVTITVNPVDDAPENTVPGGQTTDEDTVLVFNATNSNLISVGDVDSASSPLQVTLTSTNGDMTLSQVDGLDFSVGTGTAESSMTFIGTIANINAALDGLSFDPGNNFNGAANIQIQTSDLASEVVGNDAIFGSSTTPADHDKEQIGTQITIAENGTITSISAYLYLDKVEDLRFGLYSDVAGEPSVLLAESGSVSQVAGTNWYTIDIPDTAVTAGNYWIAMDIGKEGAYYYDATGGQTRYSNYDPAIGLEPNWTSTYASNTQSISVYANLTPDTGTPLSDTDNVGITVNPVNDAPTVNATASDTGTEDTDQVYTHAQLLTLIGAADVDDADAALTVAITNVVNGSVALSGGTGGAGTTFTFTPTANFVGNMTFDYQVSDDEAPTPASSAVGAATVALSGENDAPTVNATASDTGTEDTDQVYTHAQMLALIGAADVDDADAALTVAITNVVNGSVALSGGTGGAGTTFTFTPTANFVGNMTFDYQVSDDEAPTPASSAVGTATVALSAVNDAPTVNATASDTGTEDTDQVYTHAQMLTLIGAADVDDADANLSIAITSVVNGSVALSGGTGGVGTTFTFTPTGNFVGNMTFDYQLSDDDSPTPATSTVGTATVALSAVNDAPTVNATASDTGTEDTDQVYTHAQMLSLIGAADVDDVDAVLSVAITNVVNGSIALSGGTGGVGTTFTFTPTGDFVGNMTFDYQVSDDEAPTPASSAVGTATVALSAVNDAPTVNATASDTGTEDTDQVYTHAQMLSLIGAADVDDVDANLTAAITNVINGSVVLTGGTGGAGTTFTFTPTGDFVGNMTFDYQVSDDDSPTPATSAVGTATVTLSAVNDAPTVNATASDTGTEDTDQVYTHAQMLTLIGASDVDDADADLSVAITNVVNGSVALSGGTGGAGTTFTFTPTANFVGNMTFDYQVSDDDSPTPATSAVGTATVTLSAVNDAPTVNATASDTGTEDTDQVYTHAQMLTLIGASDVDDADADLSVAITNVNNGSVVLTGGTGGAGTTFTFTPTANFVGNMTFDYQVSDDDSPTPASSAVGTATVTLSAVNDAPTVNATASDTGTEDTDQVYTHAQMLTLIGAADVDDADANLSVAITNVVNGSIALTGGTGGVGTTFTFTPTGDLVGNMTFDYQVSDDDAPTPASSAVGTATVALAADNDAPTVNATASDTGTEDTDQVYTHAQMLTLIGAADVDDADANLSIAITNVVNGSVALSGGTGGAGTTFTFTPTANFVGNMTFDYQVSDDDSPTPASSAVGTATVTLSAVNDAPTVNATASDTGTEDTDQVYTHAQMLTLIGAADVDDADANLSVAITNVVNGSIALTGGTGGVGTTFTFTPTGDLVGNMTFDYQVSDDEAPTPASSAIGTATVALAADNDAPTINATASDTGTEDTDQVYTHAQMLTLIGASDVDDADAALTVAITNVVNGSIALSGGTGGAGTTFTFTPTANFVGNMTFDYQVSDDEAPTPASSAVGTATVALSAVNDAPTVNATASDTGTEDTGQVYTHAQMLTLIGAADVDDADANLSIAITNVVNGSIALSGGTGGVGTTFTFTPTGDFVGNMTFDYQVSDDDSPTPASSAVGTATVALSAVNDAPTVNATASDTGTEDTDQVYTHAQMLTLIGAADVDDADAALTVAITNVNNGSVVLTGGTGGAGTTFTFTPTTNFVGNMTFDYQVSDDDSPTPASSAVGTATVTLSAVNDAPTVNATASDTGTEDTDQVYTHAQMLTLIGAADVDDADANLSVAITNVVNGSIALTGGTGGVGTTFTFTPTGDLVGNMTFDYQVSDDEAPTPASSAIGTATVALAADNDAPTINATASDTGTEDTDQVYTHAQMLTLIGASDVDDADAALTVAITNVVNGSIALSGGTGGAGTTFTFTPTANFVGNMTFDYQVSDDEAPTPASSAVGTATVALSAVNDAPTVNATASDTGTEDTGQVYTHAQMLTLIGAADVDDADANLSIAITNVVNGSIALSGGTGGAGTTFTFTPTTNFVGNMTFDYQVSDDDAPTPASSAVGTATVALAADNDAPTVNATASDTGTEDTDQVYTHAQMLTLIGAADVDDADANLSIAITNVVNGSVALSGGTGGVGTTFTFTPTGNFVGNMTFDYQVSDDDAPTPASSAVGTATVALAADNDAPTVNATASDTGTEDTDQVYTHAQMLTLIGAADVDDADANLSIAITNVVNGSIALSGGTGGAGTTFTFTPTGNFVGNMTFDYQVSDDDAPTPASSAVGTATVALAADNDAPTVNATASDTGTEDTDQVYTHAQMLTLIGAADVDDADANLSIAITNVVNGSIALSGGTGGAGTTFTFTPTTNFVGNMTFDYQVSDDDAPTPASSVVGTATMALSAENDAPTVSATASDTGTEDTDQVYTHAQMLTLIGAADVDDADANLSIAITSVFNGSVALSGGTGGAGTTFTFTPTTNFVGNMTFDYQVSDDDSPTPASSAVGTATVTLSAVNDAPTVNATASDTGTEDTDQVYTHAQMLTLIGAADVDDADANLSVAITNVVNGSIALTGGTGGVGTTFTFTPTGDLVGNMTFDYQVSDDEAPTPASSAIGTATVALAADNDAPTINATASDTGTEDTDQVYTHAQMLTLIGASDVDDADAALTVAITNVVNGSIALSGGTGGAGTTFTFTPTANFVGNMTFDYQVSDDEAPTPASSAVGTATVALSAVNDAPTVNATASDTGTEDTGQVYTHAQMLTLIGAADVDDADANLSIAITNVVNGSIALSGGTGGAGTTFTFTPTTNFVGNMTFDYQVSDDDAPTPASSAVGTATVALAADNDAPTVNATASDTGTEDTDQVYTHAQMLTLIGAADVDDADANLSIAITNVVNGSVALSGGTGGVGTTFTFTPTGNFVGNMTFDYQVSDDDAPTPASSAVGTATVALAADNDAPTVNATASDTGTEDTDQVYTHAQMLTLIGAADVDDADANLSIAITNVVNGSIALSGGTGGAGTTFTFTPTGNFVGNMTFDYQVSDDDAPTPASSAVGTATVALAADNDAPTVNATASDTGTEDTDQVYTHAQMLTLIGAADVDDADANLSIAITSVVNGSVALSGGTGGAGTTFTFTPTGDFVGNMTFDYQVSDDDSPTPASSAVGTATMALSAENDAPTVSATASDTGTEDTDQVYTHAQMLTLIGAADVDDADANLSIAITNVVNGSIALSGGTGGAGTTFTFTPTGNFVGNMTFDYQVSDDDAPTPASSAVGTATVALAADNDAPTVNATASDTGTEDTDQVYTHAQMLTLIGASDVDDADANLSIAITSVVNGSVALSGGTGGAGTTFTFTPTGDFVGNMTFDYQVSDDNSPTPDTSAVGTATVALAADNDAPTVNATASDTGTEDTDQVYTHAQMLTLIGAADVDDADANLSIAITNVVNGSIALSGGTGGAGTTFTFTPTTNFVGNMTFDYQVSDDDAPTPASSAVGTATVALAADNDAPTVNATASDTGTEDTDQVYTHAQMLTLIGAADVDDADANLSIAITNVVNGSIALTGGTGGAGTTFTFTPTGDFVGNMTFDYQVSDDEAPTPTSSAVGTATVALSAVNDAPTVNATASDTGTEDTDQVYTHAQMLTLIGAADVDDADANLSIAITNVLNGSVALSGGTGGAGTTFTFTPTGDFVGNMTFDYQVSDDDAPTPASSAVGTATVALAADNDAPTVNATASDTGTEDTDQVYTHAQMLTLIGAADVDDADANLSIAITNVVNGSIALSGGTGGAGTTFTFTPTGDFVGNMTFDYQVSDDDSPTPANSAMGTATVALSAVNDTPTVESTIADQSLSEDFASYTIDLNAAFDDVETTDASLVYGVSGNTNINVSIASGIATITTTADWNGSETLTFTATDSGTLSASQAVVFAVSAVSDIADDNAVAVVEDTATVIAVLANDSFEGTPVVTATSTPGNGAVVINGDNTLTYTPDLNFTGADSFTYTVTSGGVTETATVNLTVSPVNDSPMIGGTDAGAVTEDVDPDADTLLETGGALTIADPDAGESSFVAGTVNGTYGDLLIDSIGNWSYSADNTQPAIQQLDALETLTDTLTVTTADGSTHDVIITINGADDLPVANDDSGIGFITDEDTAFTTGDVLGNDTPGDGPATVSTYDAVSANGGSVSYNGDGTFTYTPATDFNGADTFTYTIADVDNDTSTATVTITVTAANDAPDAVGDSYTLLQNSSLEVTVNGLLANDSDVDGDSLTVTLVDGTANGTLTLNSDGTFSYVPDEGFIGDDSFTYLANDGIADSQLMTVLLQVASPTEEPTEDTTIVEDDPATPPTDDDTNTDPVDTTETETTLEDDDEIVPENLIDRTSGWEETTLDEVIDEIVLLDEDAIAELLGETLFEPVDNSVVEVTRADPLRTADRTPRVPFEPNSNLKYGGTYEYDAILNDHALWKEVESMQAAMEEAFDAGDEQGDMFVKVSAGTSLTLTAGFVSYLLRAGTLLSSMLSFLPVWKGVDPLAVLVTKPREKDKKKNKGEDELENEQVSEDRQGDVDHLFNKGSE